MSRFDPPAVAHPMIRVRRAARATQVLALVAAALLAWSLAARRRAVTRVASPRMGRPVPDFTLTDQAGRAVTRASLAGSVWVADFIFTRCAGQCPLMSAQMATLQRAFERVPGVQLVSFSVDPEHDTQPVLAAYAAHYAAQTPRWRFLTGSREAVWRLAREGFQLGVGEGGTPAEPIAHSVRLVLVDQTGLIRGTYDATDTAAVQRLREEVDRLVGGR